MFGCTVICSAALAVFVAGMSFEHLTERACRQNPFLRYCLALMEKRNSVKSTVATPQIGLKVSGTSFGPMLFDSLSKKEVFRSSAREFPTSDRMSKELFCDEDEARYRQLCIERVPEIRQELFRYCTDYEKRCPQNVVDEKDKINKTRLEKNSAMTISSGSNSQPEGFVEESSTLTKTFGPDGPSAEEIIQYCEKYERNFLYFCIENNNDGIYGQKARVGRFCEAYADDCPDKLKRAITNFPEKFINTTVLSEKESSGNDNVKGDKNEIEQAEIEDYCGDYHKNYDYYCVQGNEADDKLTTEKFCKAYKKVCHNRKSLKNMKNAEGDEVSVRGDDIEKKPPNPFETFVPKNNSIEEVFNTFKHPHKLAQLAKPKQQRVPCTIDCDPKKYPHCTPECKCDLIYPAVQKFCNPPPLPLFLQTCRMWYTFCPKYKQYHYASQFIYSKSSKGKVGPGRASPFETVPENTPIPFAGKLLERVIRGAQNHQARTHRQGHEFRTLRDFVELDNSHIPQKRPFQFSVDPVPPWERAPYTDRISPNQRPRAFQAVYEGNIHDFDKYTDAGGRVKNQLYSRSPWTKPGLWEANPSNPHNRDHANKFSYNPDSVTVDWLNGQVYWGAHWAVPASSVGGTNGYASVHFPAFGTFFGIEDDYD